MKPILSSSTLFFQLIISVSLIAALRTLVGIKSYGVFGPTIITFGLLKIGLVLGLTMYLNIFLVAMFVSLMLYKLRISSSYRVSIIITSVVVLITFLELSGELFHIRVLQSAIFFPVLITSWLADRFVVQVKEVGWVETSKKLFGTLILIIIVYFVITFDAFIMFISITPETWLFIIILNLYLAHHSNFRLTDYRRFKSLLKKQKKEILTLNMRNREYVAKYNPVELFSSLTKDKMKLSFHQLNIPTAETYIIIEQEKDMDHFDEVILKKQSFVVKPTRGLGGEGILVIDRKKNKWFHKQQEISFLNIKKHIIQILDGQFTNGNEDKAIIEEKLVVTKKLESYFGDGVFDIRVIVFCGYPVMSMMRIPTKESKGLANIHKGAISMGLDISTGKPINPFWKFGGGSIKKHPDTGKDITKIKISHWTKILEIACLAQGSSKLNYVGVDITISTKGIMVFEVNKRPGLEIQNANLDGLLKRLQFIEKDLPVLRLKNIKERIRLVKKFNKAKWK